MQPAVRDVVEVVNEEEDQIKRAEIQLAAAVACHTSIKSMDHISSVITKYGKGSTWEKIAIKRTKAGMIIQNVIAAEMKLELKQSLAGGHKFAIMIDESTDVSTTKLLAVIVRYYNVTQKSMMNEFMGLVEVVGTRGEELFNHLQSFLDEWDLNLKDCVAFASDGANNVSGQYNSVWSRVRDLNPLCVQVKCTSHSLDLIVKHAFEKIPSSVAFLLKELPSHFSNSSLRREGFVDLFKTMCPDEVFISPFVKYSVTRWLVRGKVTSNILSNWWILSAYFNAFLPVASSENRYKVRQIVTLLNNKGNFLMFTFLTPIIQEFERVNSAFQVMK